MTLISTIRGWIYPEDSSYKDADPQDMRVHVRAAYGMLADANRQAIQVPNTVIDVITTARAADNATLPQDVEAKFWNAYGLLSSSIRPAEKARRLYRLVFYIVLLMLLIAQFFFIAADSVNTQILDLGKQIQDAQVKKNEVQAELDDDKIEQLQQTRRAYINFSKRLFYAAESFVVKPVQLLRKMQIIGTLPQGPDIPPQDDLDIEVTSELKMFLTFLSGYLLPMLYGLLGACAFVLRNLADQAKTFEYAHDARVVYSLRLNIGLLAGLAVGWFVSPTASGSAVASLSPLALAFIAGYGSDIFFSALDRMVGAFSTTPSTSDRVVRDVTTGNMTQHMEQNRSMSVAGGTNSIADGDQSNTADRTSDAKDGAKEASSGGRVDNAQTNVLQKTLAKG